MEQKFKIICPWCDAPYDAEMLNDLYAAGGCDTCGPDIGGKIEIKCSNCKKVVYVKEY